MRRVMLKLRYDGGAYHGWQVQNNAMSVQTVLQNAAEEVLGMRPNITGCSRTDAGVHANMFCCHLDIEKSISDDRLIAALNAHLPNDIAVFDCVGSGYAVFAKNLKLVKILWEFRLILVFDSVV